MPRIKALAEGAGLLDLFRLYPESARPLLSYHEVLLRGPSPLSVAERELIAAYVSGLNDCGYCHGIHRATAERFGIAPAVLEAMLADLATSDVDARLKPLLAYVRKLTLTPARMTPSDADPIRAAGWDDRALHDAVSITGLFNLMNRIVEGTGVVPQAEAASRDRLRGTGRPPGRLTRAREVKILRPEAPAR